MYARFIATITAAAIAITAIGAVPAYAGEKDLARALAAIAGIAIVGKIIHDEKKKKRARFEERRQPVQPVHPHPRRGHVQPWPGDVEPRPLPRRVDNKLLPAQCFESLDTYLGKVRMFGRRCLNDNYRFTANLPAHCQYSFDTYRGQRVGYEARCLRDQGYRLARG